MKGTCLKGGSGIVSDGEAGEELLDGGEEDADSAAEAEEESDDVEDVGEMGMLSAILTCKIQDLKGID